MRPASTSPCTTAIPRARRRRWPRAGVGARRQRRAAAGRPRAVRPPAGTGGEGGRPLRPARRAGQQRLGVLPTPFGATTPAQWDEIVRDQRARAVLPRPGRGAAPRQRERRDRQHRRHLRRAPVARARGVRDGQGRAAADDPRAGAGTGAAGAGERGVAQRDPVARERQGPEAQSALLARTPLGRIGTPGEIAEAVRWLLRDARYCTGQVLRVDGGRMLDA